MKRIVLPALLGLLVGAIAVAAPAAADRPLLVDRHMAEAHLDRILRNIDAIDQLSMRHDRRSRWELRQRIGRLRDNVEQLRQALERAPERPAPRPAPRPTALSAPEMHHLVHAIDQASYSNDKLAVLRDAARYAWFDTAQVMTLMDRFSFSADKVKAAALLYPRVLDPNHFYQVYQHLTFSSARQQLHRLIEQEQAAATPPSRDDHERHDDGDHGHR